MATYQDAITAMETSGVWVSSERTELAGIYTDLGTSYTENQWGMIRQSILNATGSISEISVPEYGKEPAALTDEEIMEIRNEFSEGQWIGILQLAAATLNSQIIEAIWDVEENRYTFTLALTAGADAFITYAGSAGMPKIFPAKVEGTYGNASNVTILKDSEIPKISAGGVLYAWYSSSNTTGAMLKAGDELPLIDTGDYNVGTVYAGIAKEEVSVQMRTKQTINGAIQEFLVYPKTQRGGGGGGSQIVEWDGDPSGLAEAGEACLALWESGIIPSVRIEHDTFVGLYYNAADGVTMEFVCRRYRLDASGEVITGEDVSLLTLVYAETEWTDRWSEGYFPAGE